MFLGDSLNVPSPSQNFREPISYRDQQKLKYARGHLFRSHTAKTLENYQVSQNAGPIAHELTLFV